MRWLILLGTVLAVVIFAIARRKIVERRPPAPPPVWDTRTPIAFEEFFRAFYATSGLEESVVFKLLEFVALSSGVNYKLIRPEDPLDSFPGESLKRHVRTFAETMARATCRATLANTIAWANTPVETVDDFIRKLGPLATQVEEHQRQLHNG